MNVRGKGTGRPLSHARVIDNGKAADKKAKNCWADDGGEHQEGLAGKWSKTGGDSANRPSYFSVAMVK